jgi:hypothetical protein
MSGGGAPVFPLAAWAGTTDLIAAQSYQISNCYLNCQSDTDSTWSLQASLDFYDHAYRELGPFIANPQSFAFTGGRYPTPPESRNMLFGALVAGAKGIIYYAFYDDHGLLPEQSPTLWAELKKQTAELTAVTPFLTNGARTRLDTRLAHVHAAYWRLGTEVLAVVLNTDRSRSYDVAIGLPQGLGDPTLLFADDSTPMRNRDGVLTGEIAPVDVHVYRLDPPPASTSTSTTTTTTPQTTTTSLPAASTTTSTTTLPPTTETLPTTSTSASTETSTTTTLPVDTTLPPPTTTTTSSSTSTLPAPTTTTMSSSTTSTLPAPTTTTTSSSTTSTLPAPTTTTSSSTSTLPVSTTTTTSPATTTTTLPTRTETKIAKACRSKNWWKNHHCWSLEALSADGLSTRRGGDGKYRDKANQ